jgi:hypothetical protein
MSQRPPTKVHPKLCSRNPPSHSQAKPIYQLYETPDTMPPPPLRTLTTTPSQFCPIVTQSQILRVDLSDSSPTLHLAHHLRPAQNASYSKDPETTFPSPVADPAVKSAMHRAAEAGARNHRSDGLGRAAAGGAVLQTGVPIADVVG